MPCMLRAVHAACRCTCRACKSDLHAASACGACTYRLDKKRSTGLAERARDEPVNPAAFQIKNENKACCMNAHARTKLHSPITIESKACCVHMHAACSCMQMAHVLHAEANRPPARGIRAGNTNALLKYSSGLKRQVRMHHKQRGLFMSTTKKRGPSNRDEKNHKQTAN